MSSKQQHFPRYSKWVDKKDRLFIVLHHELSGSGFDFEIVSIELLNTSEEKVDTVKYADMESYVSKGMLKRKY